MRRSTRGQLFFEQLETRLNPGDIPQVGAVVATAGPGLGTVTVVNYGSDPTKLNDDNTAGWPKTHFVSHDVSFAKTDYIDRVYRVNDTEGVTEFNFEDNIINGTANNWTTVQVQLGFGTGDNFIPAAAGELDFDWPDKDSGLATNGWAKVHDQYAIGYTAAVALAPGLSVKLFYSVDVPDYDPEAMPGAYVEEGVYQFTLRTIPGPKPGGASPVRSMAADMFAETPAADTLPVSSLMTAQPSSDTARQNLVAYPAPLEGLSLARPDDGTPRMPLTPQENGRANDWFVAVEDLLLPEM
jgi:hypothetical protein